MRGRRRRTRQTCRARRAKRVTVAMLKQGIDWAVKQNAEAGSRFQNKLDLNWIVVMGHSCGGGLAVQLTTEDTRERARHLHRRGLPAPAATMPPHCRRSKGRSC